MKKLPILVVACLCVDANDLSVREDSAILKLEWGWVVSILSKLMQGLIIQPVSPGPWETINGLIDELWWEILDVNWPCIVVTLNRVDWNIWWIEDFLDSKSNIFGSIAYFEDIIGPHIVRGIVTSPEKDVWLYHISYVLEHVIEGSRGKITFVGAEESSLSAWVIWEPIILAAAQEPSTLRISANRILEVNMRIGDLNSLQNLTRLIASSNLFINLIQIVIVLEWLRLCSKELVYPILTIEYVVVAGCAVPSKLAAEKVRVQDSLSQWL